MEFLGSIRISELDCPQMRRVGAFFRYLQYFGKSCSKANYDFLFRSRPIKYLTQAFALYFKDCNFISNADMGAKDSFRSETKYSPKIFGVFFKDRCLTLPYNNDNSSE